MPSAVQIQEPKDLLRVPLEALEDLGLGRPAHLTMERYLHLLVGGELLPQGVVDAYLELFQEAQYGERALTEEEVRGAVAALGVEVHALGELDEADLAWVRLQLNPPEVKDPAPPPVVHFSEDPRAQGGVAALAEQIPRLVKPTSPEYSPAGAHGQFSLGGGTQQLPSPKVLGLGLSLLLIWSAVMLALGYRNADEIKSKVGWIQRRGQPPAPTPLTPRQRMEALRAAAGRAPGDKERWMRYGIVAQGLHHYADAVHAYRHIIRRWPREAMALNNLAWLYLTAQAPYARDAAEGLRLAEQAYAVDQAPYITDTLAEACYQNGQVERAVKLEQDALDRSKKRKGIFRRSLERYKRALKK